MKKNGKFITFEGCEGSGKSTQTALLAQALAKEGAEVQATREPGGTPGAEAIRTLLLETEYPLTPLSQLFLHFAARAEHVEKQIRPALQAGTHILCDRYIDSTLAYQTFGLGVPGSYVEALAGIIDLTPDLTIILDAPLSVLEERLSRRGNAGQDRYERMGSGFFSKIQAAFRQIAQDNQERCILFETSSDPLADHEKIIRLVKERLFSDQSNKIS